MSEKVDEPLAHDAAMLVAEFQARFGCKQLLECLCAAFYPVCF